MDKKISVLAINPGSTSTKIALFDDYDELFSAAIRHGQNELNAYPEIQDQLEYRTETIEKTVAEMGFEMGGIDAFSGRGGGLLPVSGGVYAVSDLLVEHASRGMSGQHPAQLGSQIAKKFADEYGKRAFVVNPPGVDEFHGPARVTGVKGLHRQSHLHALNQKEIALRFCASRGLVYDKVNLVICHLGGGISITAHEKGSMIDSNDLIRGSGPMSPTRAGDLPYMDVIDLAYSGDYTKNELIDKLNREGGLTDHFGTSDIREVYAMMENGDRYAGFILDGMAYQTAKYAGAMATVLRGKIGAFIITGGVANRKKFVKKLKEYIDWIAEVVVMPGEFELEALAAGAVRVMTGQEEAKTYIGIPVWNGVEATES